MKKNYWGILLTCLVLVLVVAVRNKFQIQEQVESLSVYEALTKDCQLDPRRYGTCHYQAGQDVSFNIRWSPGGLSVDFVHTGSRDGKYYVPFDNLGLALGNTSSNGIDLAFGLNFNSGCIPVLAGKKLKQHRARSAFVSPIDGMIYEKEYECRDSLHL